MSDTSGNKVLSTIITMIRTDVQANIPSEFKFWLLPSMRMSTQSPPKKPYKTQLVHPHGMPPTSINSPPTAMERPSSCPRRRPLEDMAFPRSPVPPDPISGREG